MAKSTDKPKVKKEEIESEEVEDQDDPDETTDDDESTNDEDEETADDDDESDDSEDEDEDDSETSDDDDDDDEEPNFKKRFTQFEGETLDEYTKSLEDGFANSSTEGQRLKGLLDSAEGTIEKIAKVVAENPDIAEKLAEAGVTADDPSQPPKDATMQILEQQVRDQQQKEYNEFRDKLLDDGVDIEVDSKLANELNSNLALVKDHIWRTERRIVGMGEGLERAWKLMGKETTSSKDKVRSASKKIAGQSRNSGSKKAKGSSAELTAAQAKVAAKFGLDPKAVAKHVR